MSAATMDSFIEILRKSGLITESRLQARLKELGITPQSPADHQTLAKAFIQSGDVTTWQAEKLLSGKHKGFFLGKYKLLRLLGRGGMSAVYLAEHILMKRRCAIKVLPANRVNDSSYLGRFHLEAQAAAALDDPNIVRAYDVDHFIDGKTEVHFLVMEYVEGKNLHDLVAKGGPLQPLDAAEYVRQAAMGLAHAHQAGLVHRDIKPGNLLLDLKGTIKILDMGLARFFDESDENSLTIQHDERVLGTADFLSPEQAINSHNVDARADIYSLGCTLYFLLTKHAPFEQGSLAQRLLAHQTQEPMAVTHYRADVPDSLLSILGKMMAKKPDDRYASAQDVASALKTWIAEHADEAWLSRHGNQWDVKGKPRAMDSPPTPAPLEAAEHSPGADEFGQFLTMIGKEQPFSSGFSPADSAPRSGSPSDADSQKRAPSSRSTPAPKSGTADTQPVAVSGSVLDSSDIARSKPASTSGKPSSVKSKSSPRAERPDSAPLGTPPAGEEAPPAWLSGAAGPSTSAAPGSAVMDWAKKSDVPLATPTGSEPGSSTVAKAPTTKKEPPNIIKQLRLKFAEVAEIFRKKPRLVGAIVLGIGLLLGLVYWFGSGKSQSSPPVITEAPDSPQPSPAPVEIPEDLPIVGVEISVGPGGTFATLNQAIDYLIKYNDPLSITSERKIRIAAGVVITEPLKILDPPPGFPKKMQILSQSNDPVLWKVSGKEPLLHLKNVQGLTFENFRLETDEAQAAVMLEGRCPGLTLRKFEINGFSGIGIKLAGVAGLYTSAVRLEGIKFLTERLNAKAIQLDAGDAHGENILIERCLFAGNYAAGVELASDLYRWVNIKECRFHGLAVGVDLTATVATLEELVLGNNTFHQCSVGIRFRQMPDAKSNKLGIVRNLFVGSVEHDMLVDQGFTEEAFRSLLMVDQDGTGWNWTTRPLPTAQGGVNLFDRNGRHSVTDLKFQSVDPAAGNFLKPADGKGRIEGAPNFKSYVGAVSP